MTRQLAPERPAAIEHPGFPPSATGLVVAAAAVRGAAVAASGLILAAGLALMLWAVTPASGTDAGVALQGGVVAFAAANLMPVVIGGITLSLPPLLLTLVIGVLLASTARRGRFQPEGRYQEAVSVLVAAAVYGIVAAATTRGLSPADAVPAGWVWTAAAIALVATATGMLRSGSAWNQWWADSIPGWARVGVRGGGIGVSALIAGGGLALSVGLIAHFSSAVGVAAIAAPTWTDGLGMAMLGLAYVPNAVIAGAGYVSGVGFEIGAGTYTPLTTTAVDLPAVPLLAAAPDGPGRSWIGLAFLVVPVAAGYLIARPAIRNLMTRSDRALAAVTGAVLTGALIGAGAAIARGGVGDGRWSTIGSPPLLLGAVVAAEVGLIAVAFTALAGGRSVPWRLAGPSRPEAMVTQDAPDREADEDLAAGEILVPGDHPDDGLAADEQAADDPAAADLVAGDLVADDLVADDWADDDLAAEAADADETPAAVLPERP